MLQRYAPSQQYDFSFAKFLPAMIGLALGIGAVYQLVIHHVPYIKLTAIIGMLAGFGCGWVIGKALQLSKCRNPMVGGITGGLLGLVAIFGSHAMEYWLETKDIPVSVPVSKYIEFRVESGWTISSGHSMPTGTPSAKPSPDISGVGVWFFWTLEALGFAACAYAGTRIQVSKPFCEACQCWYEKPKLVAHVTGATPESIVRVANAQAAEDLASAVSDPALVSPPPGEKRKPRQSLSYRVAACPTCENSRTLNVTIIHEQPMTLSKKYEQKPAELLVNVVVTPSDVARIAALGGVDPATGKPK